MRTVRAWGNPEIGEVLTCVYCGRHGTRAFVRVQTKGDETAPACTRVTACYARRRAGRPALIPRRAAA